MRRSMVFAGIAPLLVLLVAMAVISRVAGRFAHASGPGLGDRDSLRERTMPLLGDMLEEAMLVNAESIAPEHAVVAILRQPKMQEHFGSSPAQLDSIRNRFGLLRAAPNNTFRVIDLDASVSECLDPYDIGDADIDEHYLDILRCLLSGRPELAKLLAQEGLMP